MHVSGVKTSLEGVAASKVIVLIGEGNKNLKGMMKKLFMLYIYCLICFYIHNRCFFEWSL